MFNINAPPATLPQWYLNRLPSANGIECFPLKHQLTVVPVMIILTKLLKVYMLLLRNRGPRGIKQSIG